MLETDSKRRDISEWFQ